MSINGLPVSKSHQNPIASVCVFWGHEWQNVMLLLALTGSSRNWTTTTFLLTVKFQSHPCNNSSWPSILLLSFALLFFSSWFVFFNVHSSTCRVAPHFLTPFSKGVLGPRCLSVEHWLRVCLTHALENWVSGCWGVVAITLVEFGNSSSSLTPRVLILANYSKQKMIQGRWLIWEIWQACVFDNKTTENFCIGVGAANNFLKSIKAPDHLHVYPAIYKVLIAHLALFPRRDCSIVLTDSH